MRLSRVMGLTWNRWAEPAEDGDPLDAMVLLEEPTFPDIYKELEPGKGTDVRGWQNCAAAEEVIGLALVRVGRSTRRLHGGR